MTVLFVSFPSYDRPPLYNPVKWRIYGDPVVDNCRDACLCLKDILIQPSMVSVEEAEPVPPVRCYRPIITEVYLDSFLSRGKIK